VQPHHCPFDSIVKKLVVKHAKNGVLVDWTELDRITDYNSYLKATSKALEPKTPSIAHWEMKYWKRREV
jgi:hypothetical protein